MSAKSQDKTKHLDILILGQGLWAELALKCLLENKNHEAKETFLEWWIPHQGQVAKAKAQAAEVPASSTLKSSVTYEFSAEDLTDLSSGQLEQLRARFQDWGLSLSLQEIPPLEVRGKDEADREFLGFGSEPPPFSELFQQGLSRHRLTLKANESGEEEASHQLNTLNPPNSPPKPQEFFKLTRFEVLPEDQGLLVEFDESVVITAKKILCVGEPVSMRTLLPKELFSGKSFQQWQKLAAPSLLRLSFEMSDSNQDRLAFFPAIGKKDIPFFIRQKDHRLDAISFLQDETVEDSSLVAQLIKQIKKSLQKQGTQLEGAKEKVWIHPFFSPIEMLPGQQWSNFQQKGLFWVDDDLWSGHSFARNFETFTGFLGDSLARLKPASHSASESNLEEAQQI